MFWSADMAVCEANRDNFCQYAFISAHWVMHQAKALNKQPEKIAIRFIGSLS